MERIKMVRAKAAHPSEAQPVEGMPASLSGPIVQRRRRYLLGELVHPFTPLLGR
jgi:hypothetical protein